MYVDVCEFEVGNIINKDILDGFVVVLLDLLNDVF